MKSLIQNLLPSRLPKPGHQDIHPANPRLLMPTKYNCQPAALQLNHKRKINLRAAIGKAQRHLSQNKARPRKHQNLYRAANYSLSSGISEWPIPALPSLRKHSSTPPEYQTWVQHTHFSAATAATWEKWKNRHAARRIPEKHPPKANDFIWTTDFSVDPGTYNVRSNANTGT
jgi:hypothetical protein